jgi:hypothetical protein
VAAAISLVALAAWTVLVLVVAGRPLATDDTWWHLALGRAYVSRGPWLAEDPLLATPLGPPEPASWLFDVALYGVYEAFGFHGLRRCHVTLVALVVVLVVRLAWRESRGDGPTTALATAAVLCVSWYRLVQLRPELVTIAVTLGLYALLLSRATPPSRRRIVASCVLLVIAANAHAAFMLAPIAVAAGLVGVWIRQAVEQRVGATEARDASRRRVRRIGLALGLGLVAALLNPRGIRQHLSPFAALVEPRLPAVRDDWSAFDPFSLPPVATQQSVLAWGVADALLLAVALALGVGWRSTSRARASRSPRERAASEPASFIAGPGRAVTAARPLHPTRGTWSSGRDESPRGKPGDRSPCLL